MAIPSEAQLNVVLKESRYPISYAWSRLEGRPQTTNFDRALKAEVRDALWMLTRQWQLGEFQGDDAGSAVTAKLCTNTLEVTKYKANGQSAQPFEKDVPFEAKVEQRPIPFSVLEYDISLDIRLIMGRRWLDILGNAGLLDPLMKAFFLEHYGIKKPDPALEADAAICAHPETWQQYAAVAGRMIDGGKLYLELKDPAAAHYYDLADFPPVGSSAQFDALDDDFVAWFNDLFYQPVDPVNDAWIPDQLEYQFAISAADSASEKVMHAEEYYHGHLDWYNVDVAKGTPTLGDLPGAPAPPPPVKHTKTFIPAPIQFEGMPNTRWWAFEDSRTNFSYVKPDTTELSKLLLIEFGLIYANDWYLIPYKAPVGTLTRIEGLTLTNSFGENFWIDIAGQANAADAARWNMFSIKVDDAVQTDKDLLLLPTVSKVQESKPLEEVLFVRDEMANMVWGVETIVPLPDGRGKSGFEAAAEYHGFLQKLVDSAGVPVVPPTPVADGEEVAKIKYDVMNSIPENWIPFVPAHIEGSNRDIQIQRAAMPRILTGETGKPDKVRPRTSLLQVGLEASAPYFIHEEEVPRSGVRVVQSYQRTRSNDGKVYVWLGVRKLTGRGEGSSGLAFDRIVAKKTE